MSELPGYDAWATGGRYRSELLEVECPTCGERTLITAETEYGATTWRPEECPYCHVEWPADIDAQPAEPPEPDYDYDDRDEYGRYEPWTSDRPV